VSRKVGRAVVRNRIKRYIREVYRTHRARLAADVYLVIIARPTAARLSSRECADAMRRLFHKGDVLVG
jgi:ribonuclease P protein component